MQIQIDINEKNAEFFLQYLNSFKDGIIEKIVIKDEVNQSFMVSSKDEVLKRLESAQKSADYKEHDAFWKEMGVN